MRKGWGQYLLTSLREIAYPSLCLHCSSSSAAPHLYLCGACASHLHPIDPQGRCKGCFSLLESRAPPWCEECQGAPPLCYRASVFSYNGPARSMTRALKFSGAPYLAKGGAAYLFWQWERLQWPLPDLLVPIPLALFNHLQRGYNQSAELAQTLGKLMERPTLSLLHKQGGGVRQSGLNKRQREAISSHLFSVKKKGQVKGKSVLLIDDVMTTGTTMDRCAEVLWREEPRAVYALTLCKSEFP